MKFLIYLSILAASLPAALSAREPGECVPAPFGAAQSHMEACVLLCGAAGWGPGTWIASESFIDLAVLQEDNPPDRPPAGHPPGPRPGFRDRRAPMPPFGPPMGGRRGGPPLPLPPQLLERLKNLSPDEQEKVFQNNKRFQELPKDRQEELLQRLHRWQALSPEEKESIEQRFNVFNRFTPEQRQKAREIYTQHWRTLPADRRKAVVEEFRKMRGMSASEREQYLAKPEVGEHFSTDERALLKELSELPTPPPRRFPGPPRPRNQDGPPPGAEP